MRCIESAVCVSVRTLPSFCLRRYLRFHRRSWHLHSFPTRRSSDLALDREGPQVSWKCAELMIVNKDFQARTGKRFDGLEVLDRKSTRLNSSHVSNSYAVFCLKKKSTARPATSLRNGYALLCRRSPS